MEVPCYNCDKREILCHSKCEGYKGYRHKVDEVREKKMEESQGWLTKTLSIERNRRRNYYR